MFFFKENKIFGFTRCSTREDLSIDVSIRVKCPVPIHHASSHPLGTKILPVWDLEVLESVKWLKINRKEYNNNDEIDRTK